jgi:GntR family transcriptional regulator
MSDTQITRFQKVIESDILKYIRDHNLNKGDRLPSQEELARELQVSRAALRESLARLVMQGVVRQVHGIGTFIEDDPFILQSSAEINLSITEMIQSLGLVPDTSSVIVTKEPLPDLPFFENRISPEVEYVCVRRVRTANGSPFAYTVSFFYPGIPGLVTDPEAFKGSMYEFLREKCGQIITGSDTAIDARSASGEVARMLHVLTNTSVLVLYQQHHNQNNETVVYSIDYFVHNLTLKVKRRSSGYLQH